MENIDFKDLYIEEIEKILYDISCEKYRAKQIFKWIYRGIDSFEEMTDIPINVREIFKQKYKFTCLKIIKVQHSSDDTYKFLFQLKDGNTIESVLMKYKYGYSACLSTQIGCKMRCEFCASTKAGFERNLTTGEIVDQVIRIQKHLDIKISKVVFMGIGEPLDNYDNVVKAIKLLNNSEGLNIGYRHISISTSGIVPAILKLAQEKLPVTLSVSLHAPNNKVRNKIMPINKKYDINELLNACRRYIAITNKRITFEYIMIDNVNDSEKNAIELAVKLKGMLVLINIIQLNLIDEQQLKRSSMNKIKKFIQILREKGIATTIRRELGSDIDAACGQLRLKHKNN